MPNHLRFPKLLFAAVVLSLGACTSQRPAPTQGDSVVADSAAATAVDRAHAERLTGQLFYAAREEPDQHGLQVYVLFLDAEHFTAWRTRDAPAEVVNKLDHYLNEHPGTNVLSRYRLSGSRLLAVRRIATRDVPGMHDHDYVDEYEGKFDGDGLTLVESSKSGPPGGPLQLIATVTWRLAPVTLKYTVPPMRPRAD